jgi:serine/threonine-protein kinase HipA
LGGARPKANILDDDGHPWIAKFPSQQDVLDKGAWEFLAYQLALQVDVAMAPSKMEKISGNHHTFFTKRFDRHKGERIHFASAMTMTGYNEDILRNHTPSYLELAEFIQFSGARIEENLRQLWTRIVFNIAISNTDDHLRNHGFLLSADGWMLSPAFDINPSVDKDGLALNIDADDNALDYDLAKSVGEHFQLSLQDMNDILQKITDVVKTWRSVAEKIRIPRSAQELMAGAFRY